MRATAIVPVKRFSQAKRRLAKALSPQARQELCREMLGDVLEAIGESSHVERIIVVTREWDLPVVEVPWIGVADKRRTTHSKAAMLGVEHALAEGAECVAMLPGDCPLLDPAELDGALRRAKPRRVAIVPDRHGTGTNALIMSPPDAIEPAFGPGSRERHEKLARGFGNEVAVERLYSLSLDIDTYEDLTVLRQALDRNSGLAPRTAAKLAELRRDVESAAKRGSV
ncbi:MAG TPA: 2-phospho-L-lactate guanylyltransferase [Solirubrobacterales bacterium]